MQENYAFIADAIDTRCQTFTDIADDIWDHPETRFEESSGPPNGSPARWKPRALP